MPSHPIATRTLLSLLIGAIGMPPMADAAQLALAQYPAGTASREPAPNVILTLDDSGSMAYYNTTTALNEANSGSGMYALKAALREIFSADTQNVPDGRIRLGWNALNRCVDIPATGSDDGGCKGLNHLRSLDATHRANFLTWVGTPGAAYSSSRLGASGSTPTHRAYIKAGDYLRTAATDVNGPWADQPGTAVGSSPLSCRRSYSILMTDGGWNWTFKDHGSDAARGPTGSNGDADGVTQVLPDGKTFSVSSSEKETQVYRQTKRNSITNSGMTRDVSTLADLAFFYWATDLAPTLGNELRPLVRQSGSQTFGSGASAVEMSDYWNPRNNPATWQHMTTYTIGFRDAAEWPTTGAFRDYPRWDPANDTFGAGGSFAELVTGAKIWPDPVQNSLSLTTATEESRKVELWHMAINSRGKFIPATSTADLVQAFKDIFGAIVADTTTPVTSFTNAAASVARSATTQYTSGYEVASWKGYVYADTLAQGTGAATAASGWGAATTTPPYRVTTADKLDALSATALANRLILSSRDGASGPGVSFEWAADQSLLSTAQKDLLKESTATTAAANTLGQQRLNYIRGDRSLDATTLRQRASRQGDIVNSTLWYVAEPVSAYGFDRYLAFAQRHAKRLPMVYVGGNDGMLHGFSGEDGSEKIAYVPKGVIANLPALTKKDYQHRYYVDGSPFSGDVNWGTSATPDWRTLLVGALGAGGKGYFVLDVTTPGSSSTATSAQTVASNFAKANAAALVVMDKTSVAGSTTEDADIGHIMVNPVLEDNNPQKTTQIVRMNNNRWALVMGNGYNSTGERPVLLIQYLDGDRALAKIPAAAAGTPNAVSNGLSAPRLVDIDGNGTPDAVYAGDLRGNLWKFDVSASDSANWNVAFSGAPLYTAANVVGNVSTPQPITAPPVVRANDRSTAGGLMVAFGTGRNLTEGDRTDTAVQSIYSVLDNTRYRVAGTNRVEIDTSARPAPTPVRPGVVDLVGQSVDVTVAGVNVDGTARDFWTISQNDVPFVGAGAKRGWYLNLPQTGERVLEQMSFYDNSNIIELVSEVPGSGSSLTEETCAPPPAQPRKYRTLLNILDGKRPSVQVIDANHDGGYTSADSEVSRMTASTAENRITTKTKQIRIAGGTGGPGAGNADELARLPEIPLRPNWRQLQ